MDMRFSAYALRLMAAAAFVAAAGTTHGGARAAAQESAVPKIVLNVPYIPAKFLWSGGVSEKVWDEFPFTEVPLEENKKGPKKLLLKAAHDGDFFFLFAEWEDKDRDSSYRPWAWDSDKKAYARSNEADDALAMFIYSEVDPKTPCMLDGKNIVADMWLWRAEWSDISGYAYDGRFQASRDRLPHSNSYVERDGGANIWLMSEPDHGSLPWTLHIPVGFFRGGTVSSYKFAIPTGSMKDIRSVGSWTAGKDGRNVWKVQMTRALDTKNFDDEALKIGKERKVAFAVFEKSDKGDHAVTPLISLVIGKRR